MALGEGVDQSLKTLNGVGLLRNREWGVCGKRLVCGYRGLWGVSKKLQAWA